MALHDIDVIRVGLPFLSGAFGVGVGWGIFRERFKHMEEKHNELEKKVAKLEGKLETPRVDVTKCEQLRQECLDDRRSDITGVMAAIVQNRDLVLGKFEEIHKSLAKHDLFIELAIKKLGFDRVTK